MTFVMFVLGGLAAFAGVALIGFGIPINEFSLGNTLIIAGTTALVGGLIVIGLGGAMRQLNRISAALEMRPGGRPARAPEAAEPSAAPASSRSGQGRLSFPLGRRNEPPAREAAGPDQDLVESVEVVEEVVFERPRAAQAPSARLGAEAVLLDDIDEASLSPRPPRRTPAPARDADAELDLRNIRPPENRPVRTAEKVRAPHKEAAPQPAKRSAPLAPAFDSVWPADAPSPRAEPLDAFDDVRHAPSAGANGNASHHEAPKRRPEAAAITVLKSGVVDGMAYTLYTDGSIEAELAQGVVRFGSIDELRNHLEKSA